MTIPPNGKRMNIMYNGQVAKAEYVSIKMESGYGDQTCIKLNMAPGWNLD